MAGSFDIFRKYQRTLLVLVAILAMLAFFVLPPFLQMGSSPGGGDAVAAHWQGGDIHESQLERSVAMRAVVNRFLIEAAAAAGRDPSRLPLFPESEEAVVRTMLVAEEARKNGLVVSDTAINDFLAQWTNNLVRPEQLGEIIAGLRLGPTAVSQHDLFEALRAELTGRNMLFMFQTGFSGDPPGWRWDYFRRLGQSATVEVVAVPVESVAGEVPTPNERELRAFFDKYKNDLPDPRSATPGFREPRRAAYEYLVAKRDVYEPEAAKEVTDAEIAAFYEKNKATMFRTKSDAAADKAEADKDAGDKDGADKAEKKDAKPEEEKKATAPETGGTPPKPEAAPKGAALPVGRFQTVAFRQPAAEAKPAAADAAKPADVKASEAKPAESKPAEKTGSESEPTSDTAIEFEPLEKVKDKIREQLARERSNARVDAVFTAVAGDLTRYAEDLALWQARQAANVEAPKPPDIDVIAQKQSLEAGRSKLVTAEQAVATGGIGQSFEFIPDPGSRFGIRQPNWIDSIFGQNTMSLRPVTSRDVAGNRYLSWKTEDQAEFTPTFEAARAGVEYAWRVVEGRGIARAKAEAIAAQARSGKQSLEAALAGRSDVKVAQAGPFTWMTAGSAAAGVPPSISQPAGVEMPGEEFMKAVFGLEPGEATVAFNEPRTVCYCIRLVSLEPPVSELRDRFLEARKDPRPIGMLAQAEFSEAFGQWIEGLEKRYGLTWKRQPRVGGR